MAPHRALIALSVLAVVALGAVGCTGTVNPDVIDTDAGAPVSAPSASAGAADTVSVALQPASSGSPRIYTQISVGGGSPFLVEVDTGSTGLFVDQSAVGSSVTTTGSSFTIDYLQSDLTSELATATVEIGGVQTAAPITLGLVAAGEAQSMFDNGAKGIMGVAPADGKGVARGLLSPLIQLPAPYNRGFQIDMPASGTGTLEVGQPTAGSTTVTAPLTPLASAPSVPGATFWQKDVSLCWTVGSLAANCAPTDLDTGAPRTAFNSSTITGLPEASGLVASGQSVALATPSGASLWSFTTGTTVAQDAVALESLGGNTTYNTGIGFYFTHIVGFDWAEGTLQLTAR